MKQNLYTPGLTVADMWRKLNNQYELNIVEQIHLIWQNFYDFTYTAGIYIFFFGNLHIT